MMNMTVTIILFLLCLVLMAKFCKATFEALKKHDEAINEDREALNSLIMFLGTQFEEMEIEDFYDGTKKED